MGRGKKKARAPKKRTRRRSSARRGRRANQKRGARSAGRLADAIILAVLMLATYFAVFGGEFSVFQIGKLEALEARRAVELARSEAAIDSLRQTAERLLHDADAIEKVARERYGMIRDGEILYRFRESEQGRTRELPKLQR